MSAELDLAAGTAAGDRQQWQTVGTDRTILAVVHNVTAATRLLDILPLIATDPRIQVLFTVTNSSVFTAGTASFLQSHGITPVEWDRLASVPVDLVMSASYGGRLHELNAPIIVVPHGMGYNKYLPRKPETGNRKPETGNRKPAIRRQFSDSRPTG